MNIEDGVTFKNISELVYRNRWDKFENGKS